MKKFTTITSWAAPMPSTNIDTDQIFPGRYLKTVKRAGLGHVAFEAARYDKGGNPNPDFILNKAPYNKAEILLTGPNFGCGSSREHAVWVLADIGIRVIISEQFADIFASNATNNGMLLITLDKDQMAKLFDHTKSGKLTVNLTDQVIKLEETPDQISFAIDAFDKKCLLQGLDQITLTLLQEKEISTYEAGWKEKTPWLFHD